MGGGDGGGSGIAMGDFGEEPPPKIQRTHRGGQYRPSKVQYKEAKFGQVVLVSSIYTCSQSHLMVTVLISFSMAMHVAQ